MIENTASAFQAALDGGYGIECDVQISADGEAMVHHDDALGRLTDGSGPLDAMTAAELKRVAFKASADRMLTLGELCDLVGGRTTLLIELKRHAAADLRLAARAAQVLAGVEQQPVAVMSFEPALMAELRGWLRRCRGAWWRCGAKRRAIRTSPACAGAIARDLRRRPSAVPRLPGAGPDVAAAADCPSPAAAGRC